MLLASSRVILSINAAACSFVEVFFLSSAPKQVMVEKPNNMAKTITGFLNNRPVNILTELKMSFISCSKFSQYFMPNYTG